MNIYDYIRGPLYTEYLLLALRLKLFDEFDRSGAFRTAEEIADRLKRPPHIIEALLEILCAMELLKKNQSGAFNMHAPTESLLRSDSPDYIGPILELQQSSDVPIFQEAAAAFLRGDKVVPPENEPVKPLSDAELDRLSKQKVNDGVFLSPAAHHSGQELASKRTFSDYTTAVDLGGNDGSFLCPIIDSNKSMTGIVADLPALKERAEAKIRQWNLKGRLEFREINFFVDPLPEADLYFCGFVLHDWGKSAGYFLLNKIFQALKPGGLLVLHENLLDDPTKALHLWGTHLQFVLRGDFGGAQRTSSEYSQWLKDTGFEVHDVVFGSRKSFIFATRPKEASTQPGW